MSHRGSAPLLALALGLATAACGTVGVLEPETPVDASLVVTAERIDLQFTVPAKGELEATKASPLAVPRVPTGAMKVKEVVEEGSIVEAGEIVLVFDDTQLNIELDNHKATFRSADRRTDKTSIQAVIDTGTLDVMKEVAELERDNVDAFKIIDEQIYSQLEILENAVKKEEAVETILFADAGIVLRGEYYDIENRILDVEKGQIQGSIDRVETSLGSLILKAPIGGLIVYKKNWRGSSVGVGDTLWPGNVVMSIVDPASTALNAYVLERDVAGVEVGAPAEVAIDARSNRRFRGRVTQVAEISRPIERNSPVKYSEVKIELEDGDPSFLRPGMKGEARIRIGQVQDTVVVPRTAVHGEGEGTYVIVRGDDGEVRRTVKLGPGDLLRVAVVDGLEGGETLLLRDEGPLELPGETPSPESGEAMSVATGS